MVLASSAAAAPPAPCARPSLIGAAAAPPPMPPVAAPIDPAARKSVFAGRLPEDAKAPSKRTMAALINAALHDEMIRRPELVAFGEDVAKKGGVYYVTTGLQEKFGVASSEAATVLGL